MSLRTGAVDLNPSRCAASRTGTSRGSVRMGVTWLPALAAVDFVLAIWLLPVSARESPTGDVEFLGEAYLRGFGTTGGNFPAVMSR
jgi:hypothetical protein